ncbi:hypothetical protein JMJ77_0003083, partial [Colletotrichum scovillei]
GTSFLSEIKLRRGKLPRGCWLASVSSLPENQGLLEAVNQFDWTYHHSYSWFDLCEMEFCTWSSTLRETSSPPYTSPATQVTIQNLHEPNSNLQLDIRVQHLPRVREKPR